MAARTIRNLLLFLFLTTFTSAQVLQNGIDSAGDLPTCAFACTSLEQAVNACGGQQDVNQQTWICFCQSGYLRSPTTACQEVCTDEGSNEQIASWYSGNCGDDFGATNHADAGTDESDTDEAGEGEAGEREDATPTTSDAGSDADGAQPTASDTTDSTGQTSSAPDSDFDSDSVGSFDGGSSSSSGEDESWWDGHWEWIVMLIVLVVGLSALAAGGVWLKRRHNRKKDQITSGFNEGITTRSTPGLAGSSNPNDSSFMAAGGGTTTDGRNTPTRTREAFMPYGYGYARSESRLGSRGEVDGRQTPGRGTRGTTPMGEMEEKAGGDGAGNEQGSRRKRVNVRERTFSEGENEKFGR